MINDIECNAEKVHIYHSGRGEAKVQEFVLKLFKIMELPNVYTFFIFYFYSNTFYHSHRRWTT